MSEQGCQLLISPCSLINQPQSIRFPIASQRTRQTANSHKRVSGNSPGPNLSPLPPLSLRRQVLTNGRNAAGSSASGKEERTNSYKGLSVPGPSMQVFGHPAGIIIFQRSLASTTLSLFETQSVFSSRHDWPYGYRVLPPLGPAQSCSTHATSDGIDQVTHPPETALSGTTLSGGTNTSASLPSYLFAVDVTSPKQPCSKKRALSISPLSDVIGIDFNSIIRTSPTSLVAYINGARSSPSSHPTSSPAPSDSYGHFLGVKGCSIPQTQPYLHTTQEEEEEENSSHANANEQMHNLELGNGLESQMANMVVEQQCLSQREVAESISDPNLFRSVNPETTVCEPEIPSVHLRLIISIRILQNPGANFRHGVSFLPQVPMLEEEEGELEEFGGHLCRWMDCSAVYDVKEDLDFTCYWEGCPRNLKPFNARYKLLIHMRVHSGRSPTSARHTGEKPYVCQHSGCHKAFSNSSDRAKHQRTHVDTKPYACQVPGCAKRYTDPSSLRKHIKSHSIKEQQLRKKMKAAADTGLDPLTDCLTIHPLQLSLSQKDTRLRPPSGSSHASLSAAPQGQNSPGNSHLPSLQRLPDNCRFVDGSPQQLFPGDQSGSSTCCSSLPPTGTSRHHSQTLKHCCATPSALTHSTEHEEQMNLLLCSSQYEEMATQTRLNHLMQVEVFGDSSPAANDPSAASQTAAPDTTQNRRFSSHLPARLLLPGEFYSNSCPVSSAIVTVVLATVTHQQQPLSIITTSSTILIFIYQSTTQTDLQLCFEEGVMAALAQWSTAFKWATGESLNGEGGRRCVEGVG
ncbi:hypothetical protein WMY93_020551 [Mugilogobius chulae]|uniref:C2H2-type domain-containing protein n=1 Tax=Mugilogobius chulae TaxID=88201 RepID=A0AAW0NKG2_9GOBI